MTRSFATVVGMIENNNDEKFRQIAGHFDHHADAVVQELGELPDRAHFRLHRTFHWMPPPGQCLGCIAPAAAMDDDLLQNTKQSQSRHHAII
jgi:hypothetical protein